jgi:Arc/MetJ-type ribon-helix-helix transcriptional regulator
MTQVVVRVDDPLLEQIDALIASGVVENRSAAVREGLRQLVDRHRRAAIGQEIAAAYREQPQEPDEVGWSDGATARMIAEEPW